MLSSLLMALTLVGGSPGQAASSPPSAWTRGTIEIAGLAGYARGKVFDAQRTRTAYAMITGRVAVHFGPTGSGVMRGNFALVAEGVGMTVDQEPRATGGGINLLGRYTWTTSRWRPMFLFGAGILFTDEQVPPGETTRNFTPQAGLGLQYLVSEDVAIGGEYRFHHLSNKGLTETNPGINSNLVLIGISWYR